MYPANLLSNAERARIHDLARIQAKALRRQAIASFWSDVSIHCAAAFHGLTRVFVYGLRQCLAHIARRLRTASGV